MIKTDQPMPDEWLRSTPLGRSQVRVGRVGLGLRDIGWDPANTQRLMESARDLGIRYFDVAPSYGHGVAERRLGQALVSLELDEPVISTKVGLLLRPPRPRHQRIGHTVSEMLTEGEDGLRNAVRRASRLASATGRLRRRGSQPEAVARAPRPPAPDRTSLAEICDYSYDGVMRSMEESLERLGIDRVDLLYLHNPEWHRGQAMREAYPALDALRSAGTVGAIGVGMNDAKRLAWYAPRGDFDVFLLAGRYSLLDQSAVTDLFPVMRARGISLVLAGVFNGGLLADPQKGKAFNYGPESPAMLEKALLIKSICDRHDVSLRSAALQFSFSHPTVANLLLGASTPAELEENISDLQVSIPADLWAELQAAGIISNDLPVPASGRPPQP